MYHDSLAPGIDLQYTDRHLRTCLAHSNCRPAPDVKQTEGFGVPDVCYWYFVSTISPMNRERSADGS
jgi:hypothetical protein